MARYIIYERSDKHDSKNTIRMIKKLIKKKLLIILWGSKIWAHDLGPGTTFHQQYARGEEITEDRCN